MWRRDSGRAGWHVSMPTSKRVSDEAGRLCAFADGRSRINGVGRDFGDTGASCASCGLLALLVRVDFLFVRMLQVVRRLLEFGNTSSKRRSQFGELARAKSHH